MKYFAKLLKECHPITAMKMKPVVLFKYLTVLLSLMLSLSLSAQDAGGGADPIIEETMGNIYLVAGTMSAGAILGLSTLSFVEEPKDNLNNIVMGGALGIILGVGIVAYMQAIKGQELYLQEEKAYQPSRLPRELQYAANSIGKNRASYSPLGMSLTFRF